MAVHLVTYDLKQPGRNYQPVYDYLKRFAWCHHLESVWLIDTNLSPSEVRDALMRLVDSNDVVFVARLSGAWASYNYGCANWLNDAARTWSQGALA